MPLSVPNNSGDNLTTVFRHIEEYLYHIAQNGGGGGGASLPDQTGNAGKFLTTDGTTASWENAPVGLPQWELTTEASPDTSQFKPNNVAPGSTTLLTFEPTSLNGTSWAVFFNTLPAGSSIILTSLSTFEAFPFLVSSVVVGEDAEVSVTNINENGGSWPAGFYGVSLVRASVPQLADVLIASSISPAVDGETTPITAITTQSGIVTNKS